jgi:hypothetical protein
MSATLFHNDRLNVLEEQTCALLQGTAEDLWGTAQTILQSGYATADEWEMLRATLSHALAVLMQPAFARKIDSEASHIVVNSPPCKTTQSP